MRFPRSSSTRVSGHSSIEQHITARQHERATSSKRRVRRPRSIRLSGRDHRRTSDRQAEQRSRLQRYYTLRKTTSIPGMSADARCLGELQSVDGYMNIALEQTKEYVDGKMRKSYGDAFVRGNNGTVMGPMKTTLEDNVNEDTVMYISADS